jgi:hypothetical protein
VKKPDSKFAFQVHNLQRYAVGFPSKTNLPMTAPHRFMGGNLVVKLEISNIQYFKPFSRKVVAELKVERAKTSDPYGPGTEVIYKGSVGLYQVESSLPVA